MEAGNVDEEWQQQPHSEQHNLLRPAGEQMNEDGQAAELRRAGEEIEEIRSHEGCDAKRNAEPIANDGKDRLSSDDSHPAAHLHVHDDGEGSE